MDISDPKCLVQRSYLIVDAFTLNASEERYIPIVSYDEPATISNYTGTHIHLHIPTRGGYFDVGPGWPWQLPVGAYVFTLKVISQQTPPNEVVCKTWVDDLGKLHFVKA